MNWGWCFLFLFLLFRTGICAQSENWESRTYREHNKNKRLTNPNLSAKVHEEAKQGEGRKKKKTCSNIQNTKKKSYLKVALFFCCKREEGNDAMRWWKCWWCVCFVLFFLFFVSFSWMDWLTELWLQSCLNSWEQKKKKSIISLCPSFFETARNTRTQPTTSLSAFTTGTVRLSKRITLYCFTSVYTSA